jgi:hypothetical protein
MAIYTELPVFKKSYDLLLLLVNMSASLPKSYKYTFGERLQLESIEMIINIYKSNTAVDKQDHILKSREHLEAIRLLVRVLYDTKQINLRRMIFLNSFIEEISKQLTGWQKHFAQS